MLAQINLYVVRYQLASWNLPPHVYEHYAVVPTKSEAIWIAKKLAGELKTKALKDFSVTVSQQMCVNGVYSLKTTHIIDEQGYRKIKADI